MKSILQELHDLKNEQFLVKGEKAMLAYLSLIKGL